MQETQETQVQSPGREDPLEEGMAAQSSTLAWRIPWTEEPGGLQSTGSQRVGHDWATEQALHAYESFSTVLDGSVRKNIKKKKRRDGEIGKHKLNEMGALNTK